MDKRNSPFEQLGHELNVNILVTFQFFIDKFFFFSFTLTKFVAPMHCRMHLLQF